MEDLNFLFFRRWAETQRAQKAQCAESRKAHEQLAQAYDERIQRRRSCGLQHAL